ncbi:MAG: cysteine desulfurase-like protein [Pseudomonadota bacterium]|nr:cysteine desulfurase-like protein [Pseudomonadota bacterium]
MTFPIEAVRAQFPSLATTDEGLRRIYLDNAAGTQVPRQTIDRIVDFFYRFNSNTGVFNPTSVEVDALYDEAVHAMADFLGTPDSGEVLIGANMTTLTYQLSRSLGHQFQPGDEIIISRMEHEGNVSPWLQMAEDNDLVVKWLEFDRDTWRVEPALLEPLLTERTRLMALNYASNLTGGVNDVKALTKMAQDAGAMVYVDAVQYASHRLIDIKDLSCDFLACSPYKFYGPHLGVVYGKRERLESLHAYKLRCASEELPLRFSLGTPAFELIAGLMGTLDYFQWLAGQVGVSGGRRQLFQGAYAAMGDHEDALSEELLAGLTAIPGLTMQGASTLTNRVATFSFTHEKHPASAVARELSAAGVYCHWGDNYAFEVARALELDPHEGVLRLGVGHYNTSGEINEALSAIEGVLSA